MATDEVDEGRLVRSPDERERTGSIRRMKLDRRYHDRREPDERRSAPEQKLVRKILVTGDRKWDDIPRVVRALEGHRPGTILIHGHAPGADIICGAVAEALGFVVHSYPADWERYKRAAGPIRNRQMLKEENLPHEPIDIVYAFHNDIENSKGTKDMIKVAEATGLDVKMHTSADTVETEPVIDRFVGDFAFLSNFHPSTIVVDGHFYKSVEHAYQALKTTDPESQRIVREAKTPGDAKKLGRGVSLRDDWDEVKIDVMRHLVRLKFENPLLRPMLIATAPAKLIEGNHWNDKFWGVCRGEGQNWLGRILMEVRAEIIEEEARDGVTPV